MKYFYNLGLAIATFTLSSTRTRVYFCCGISWSSKVAGSFTNYRVFQNTVLFFVHTYLGY